MSSDGKELISGNSPGLPRLITTRRVLLAGILAFRTDAESMEERKRKKRGNRRGRREGGQKKWSIGKRREEEEGYEKDGETSSLHLLCLGKLITAFG